MKDEVLKAAIKVFVSVQLIVENANDTQYPGMDSAIKVKLNKLRVDCSVINKYFWKGMDTDAEIVFQDKIRRIEKILEE